MPGSYLARMTTGKTVGAWLAMLALCALLGFWLTHDPTPAYRYRLTVEVETPEGLRTGSSVIEVETSESSFPHSTVNHRVRGEAVAVDLPGGKTLFALLRSESDVDWASRVMFMLAPEAPRSSDDPFLFRYKNMLKLKGPITLPRMWPPVADLPQRSAYPMMVTFGDLADPTSVERGDPDDLAASVGEGVVLKRITVQMTEDPVTTGIDKRLAWLDHLESYRTIPDNPFTSTLPNEIGGLRAGAAGSN